MVCYNEQMQDRQSYLDTGYQSVNPAFCEADPNHGLAGLEIALGIPGNQGHLCIS